MQNQFHVHLINHGILKKIDIDVNQKHLRIALIEIHFKLYTIIDAHQITVWLNLSIEKNSFFCQIDLVAKCFAQFSDGNMNYIISRSVNQTKFICFVSFYLREVCDFYGKTLVLYKNRITQ